MVCVPLIDICVFVRNRIGRLVVRSFAELSVLVYIAEPIGVALIVIMNACTVNPNADIIAVAQVGTGEKIAQIQHGRKLPIAVHLVLTGIIADILCSRRLSHRARKSHIFRSYVWCPFVIRRTLCFGEIAHERAVYRHAARKRFIRRALLLQSIGKCIGAAPIEHDFAACGIVAIALFGNRASVL